MKPIHPDCPSMVKKVRRKLILGQEDLSGELGVSYLCHPQSLENGLSKPPNLALAQLDRFCITQYRREKLEITGIFR